MAREQYIFASNSLAVSNESMFVPKSSHYGSSFDPYLMSSGGRFFLEQKCQFKYDLPICQFLMNISCDVNAFHMLPKWTNYLPFLIAVYSTLY